MPWYYRTLFQWEYNGIEDYLLISILSGLVFHAPYPSYWNWSDEWETKMWISLDKSLIMRVIFFRGLQNPNFFFHFLHSAFLTVLIFHYPQFPHPLLPSPPPCCLGGKKKPFYCLAHMTRESLLFHVILIAVCGRLALTSSMGLLAQLTSDFA